MIKYSLHILLIVSTSTAPALASHESGSVNRNGDRPVILTEMHARLAVGGMVKKPGRVAYFKNMTLKQAVDRAGGVTPFGSVRRVELIRNGRKFVYDLRKPGHQKVRLLQNDLVNIPQKHW